MKVLQFLSRVSIVFATAHGIAALFLMVGVDSVENPVPVLLALLYLMVMTTALGLIHYWLEDRINQIRRYNQSMAIHDAVRKEMRYNALGRL